MKKIVFIILILFISNLFSNELSWVDEQVQAIKPPRLGITSNTVNRVMDPFIFLKKNRTDIEEENTNMTTTRNSTKKIKKRRTVKTRKKVRNLSLDLIFNKSAKINGNWYKTGDTINGYKIYDMYGNSVVLIKKGKKMILSTKTRNKKLIFKK